MAANTLPSAIMGVMNLLPVPNWSRPPEAWLLLYNSCVKSFAAYACRTAGAVFSIVQTMPFELPLAETLGSTPG